MYLPLPGYPLYQLGGPQLRVFRTNFFVRLVRPGVPQPEDTVQFQIPMEMTRTDVRNYLQSIYGVPVASVRTRVQHGSNRKRDSRNVKIKKADTKVAYVQLEPRADGDPTEDPQARLMEEERQRQRPDPRRPGIPSWFGV
ncbi:large ribosomal subunit protein uL23m isoform X3 [Dasypus novemcinctus]|uniref:large ribosomal subunit protein uL23m isoform X3 n=1 Tax=Dasypus novemcinctus TaxID=9361 RepID=UPI0026604726|nr:large ribosomal subunit protein uL23m isoform X3 [Dasypus novemcinctus]